MCRPSSKLSSALIFVTLLAVGCVSVDYVGRSFGPTTSVDVYFSAEEITKEYTVIGHAIGSSQFVPNDKIQEKLIEKAKLEGADAILITGIGKSNVHIGETSVDESQINASFLIYK